MAKHHHSHGSHASVPGKGDKPAVPGRQSQEHYELILKKDTRKLIGAQYNPMCAKDRMTTHTKVNECDH